MALALENANNVRKRSRLFNIDPAASRALKSFFLFWSENGNKDLQLFNFSEAEADAAGGTALLSGAANVHFIYVKKENSATDNYFKIFDDATDDTTTTDQRIVLPLFQANEAVYASSYLGMPLGTGIVVTQHTTSEGTTDGSDGGSGFIIVGAP